MGKFSVGDIIMGFSEPSYNSYWPDVHVNAARQYCLYRRYRGAITKGLPLLAKNFRRQQ